MKALLVIVLASVSVCSAAMSQQIPKTSKQLHDVSMIQSRLCSEQQMEALKNAWKEQSEFKKKLAATQAALGTPLQLNIPKPTVIPYLVETPESIARRQAAERAKTNTETEVHRQAKAAEIEARYKAEIARIRQESAQRPAPYVVPPYIPIDSEITKQLKQINDSLNFIEVQHLIRATSELNRR